LTPLVVAGTPAAVEAQLSELLAEVRDQLHADTAAVLLLDSTGAFLDTVAADGLELNVRQAARVMVGRGFAGLVAAERRPVIIERVTSDNVVNPLLQRQGVHSLVGVPVLDGSRLVGVLHAGSREPRRFSDADVKALALLADRTGHALRQNLRQADLTAAAAIQHSLLPSRLVEVPGLDLAGRYIPAQGQLGGDWYDVFTLPGGRLGFVMGDVAGHGLAAATVMGRLRSALRAYALEYEDPATVLARLDAKITHFEAGVFATVLYGVTQDPFEEFVFSSAGHLRPLVIGQRGPADFADIHVDLPLGVGLDYPRSSTKVAMGHGDALMMFTDGLIERRPPADQHAGLGALLVSVGSGDAETLCNVAIEAMFGHAAPEDDAALLVIRRTP
jgi:phosphoserine phosphatase RsbU/P